MHGGLETCPPSSPTGRSRRSTNSLRQGIRRAPECPGRSTWPDRRRSGPDMAPASSLARWMNSSSAMSLASPMLRTSAASIALRAGIPQDRIAHTVNRNCASGMEAVFSAWQILTEGRAQRIVAGGTESMSNVPLLWNRMARDFFLEWSRAGWWRKIGLLARVRPKMFKPVPALETGTHRSHLWIEHGTNGRGARQGIRHHPR